ncbi:tetratricopeptide repeat protein [Paenibacillus sp. JX-17]|uniref:Tetratricopeptide repeat protein n=1 Tax=Paenibacillus lacisoli TaxID=3064525 RepID=A0ABT9C9J1_9BACL|nr:tetratricopeptide repeat protein [Paenibacillus sp. JX-17]MDO7905902.1 tetratricopeptide repeat protein [Paenibacillus sp. JX-17]
MMSKFILFTLLLWLVGNPIVALVILLVILYVLDRRYVGVFPSLTRPLQRRRQAARLRQLIAANPNDVGAKMDLARNLIDRGQFEQALRWLGEIGDRYEHSAEYWDALGTAELMTGRLPEGEAHLLQALEINPRVKYGQPYLTLSEALKTAARDKSVYYLEQFQDIQSSSCEAYYKLGLAYRALGRTEDAKRAFEQTLEVYRSLPKYNKRRERRWAVRGWFRKTFN